MKIDLKRLETGHRLMRAVIKDTGFAPYSAEIRPTDIVMQGHFDSFVVAKLTKSGKWKSKVTGSGYVEFFRGQVEITLT